MDIAKSNIVRSVAGRDTGSLFFVLATEGDFLLLADGKQRRLENPKRKRRIAAGSGTTVADVNKLLKQYEMMQKMMKQFKKSPKGFARRLGGMMGNPNAFRGLK